MLQALSEVTDRTRQDDIEHKIRQDDRFDTMKEYFEQLGGDLSSAEREFYEHTKDGIEIVHYRDLNDNEDELRLAVTIDNGIVDCSVKVSNPSVTTLRNQSV